MGGADATAISAIHLSWEGGYIQTESVTSRLTVKAKNALAPEWVHEILADAMQNRRGSHQKVVIDLFSGWQSLRPVCQQLGLDYVAVDIDGCRG